MKVAILMGSPRDDEKMAGASEMLERFEVEHEVHVMSATEIQNRWGISQAMPAITGSRQLFAVLAWQLIWLA